MSHCSRRRTFAALGLWEDTDPARGLTVNRLIVDELREHRTWDAYAAAVPSTVAVPTAQVWFITNQGDDRSVVLKALREAALRGAYVRTDEMDE
jgi:phage terminase large subunit-like protein